MVCYVIGKKILIFNILDRIILVLFFSNKLSELSKSAKKFVKAIMVSMFNTFSLSGIYLIFF